MKKIYYWLITLFILINLIAIVHAYKFTHLSTDVKDRTANIEQLSLLDKLGTLLFGVSNPRPQNRKFPTQKFETIVLEDGKKTECWLIKNANAKGTIILFHGYVGKKESLIENSDEFIQLGYNTLLVDFMGSGGSEGNQTSVGYYEAEQVKQCFEYLQNQGEKQIFLFGHSMGAAAILKCVHDYQIKPAGIMIECPFGSMYQTTCNRFESMNVPTFPMAGLLVFWGGAINGFWAFGNNPAEFAQKVAVPTLLMYGEKDLRVKRSETDAIYKNLAGVKRLKIYTNAGHENFLESNKNAWLTDVNSFLVSCK